VSAGIWTSLAGALLGIAAGVGGFTFVYARGASYLTDDPAACANCHVMRDYHSAWQKSSHRSAAVCNDCHTPSSLIGKYSTKARNGFWHSYYFTTGAFPDNLEATPASQEIAEAACQKCHAPVVQVLAPGHPRSSIGCIRCHGQVGHRLRIR
jgi:cytochrome c nitrite reductase small subunit